MVRELRQYSGNSIGVDLGIGGGIGGGVGGVGIINDCEPTLFQTDQP